MATITYRTDDKTKESLALFAEQQNVSVNKAIDILVTNAIKERALFNDYQKRANKGDSANALHILRSKALK